MTRGINNVAGVRDEDRLTMWRVRDEDRDSTKIETRGINNVAGVRDEDRDSWY